ncbi:hypothetical protein ITJ66_08250 [Plantibacter sp. VKM Ac-2885]|uniref:DUF6264 family protein n=1 Tax=Plantibacter sp. VKM Ac-2885 TaxID=2783828 RepID=UPI00188C1955|nr:DUF6264 family protein [Plantibacter sp. VKM Ac-2885]MBF4512478.1 hypothetical protein [Plantibacter sp. VKM Ac-2885]
MSESRPRPQFGEYASPEEQRARIAEPIDEQRAEELGIAPVVPVDRQPRQQQEPTLREQTREPGVVQPGAPTVAARRPVAGDRIATSILLGLGLVGLIVTMPGLLDLPGLIRPALVQMGVSGYSSDGLASAMGILALGLQIALWVGAIILSSRSLRAGRLTFWIPLVAGVAANLVVVICLAVAMGADPAFMEYVRSQQP